MHKSKKIITLLIGSIVTVVLLKPMTVFATDVRAQEEFVVAPMLTTRSMEKKLVSRNEKSVKKMAFVYPGTMELTEPEEIAEEIEPEFSTEDVEKLTCLVFAESGNQETEGQIAVAAVVINRKRDNNEFADVETIDEVIFAKTAFASITNVDFTEAKDQGCYDAVIEAVNEEDPTEELLWKEAERLGLDPEVYAKGGALYFYNPDYCSEQALRDRANIKCKVRIGDHIFYKVWDQ